MVRWGIPFGFLRVSFTQGLKTPRSHPCCAPTCSAAARPGSLPSQPRCCPRRLPRSRAAQLLCHSATVRPQCQSPGQKPVGKIRVDAEWLVAFFYTAMNSSLWQGLPHQKALELLCFPECCPICAEQKTSCPQFMCKNFVSKGFASSVTQEETFPWFDLTAAQMRESPFSQLLEQSEFVQCHLALLHQASSGDWPIKQCVLVSTKTSLTSADESLFPTVASVIFSETPKETADCDSKST